MRSRLFRSVLVACASACVTLAATGVAAGAATTSHPQLSLVEPAVAAPKGSQALGAVGANTSLHFDVYLNTRSAAAFNAYVADVTNRHSAAFGHYLAPGEFARRFGASTVAVAAVRSELESNGLHVASSLVDGLGLKVSGRAATVETALSTSIERYRLASGTVGTATTSAVRVPTSIAKYVLGVIGLNNLVHPQSSVVRPTNHLKWPTVNEKGRTFATHAHGIAGAPSVCATAQQSTEQGNGGITDDQVASAYGTDPLYTAGDFGAGQTVAVYELEPFLLSDIAGFDECYFGTNNTSNISTINVDGGPGAGPGDGESVLDIENVSALAPKAHIDVYQASNTTTGSLDAYGQIVSNDTAKVVTTSWGLCETQMLQYAPGSLDVEHILFEQAAAQGQTVFASAGDNGADDCSYGFGQPVAPDLSVDDPASQPYVVSVGGTTAVSVATPPAEQVWNDGAEGGAGGGGTSRLWPMPSWQSNVAAVRATSPSDICGTATAQCRVTPDVTAFADEYTGITIEYEGSWYTIGGTSSSAPIWAGMLAEINESPSCQSSAATSSGVGFASPLLYEVGANPTLAAESFNDVTLGNNDVFSINGGQYAAKVGYDAASGFGSPNLAGVSSPGLASALCGAAQEATTSALDSVAPSSGSTAGGTTVTITGSGFMTGPTINVKGVSFGDFPAASFTVNSATTITATTPPAGVPKLFAKTVPAGNEGLVEVTFSSGHVAVGPTFSFVAPSSSKLLPAIWNVGPTAGPVAGGNKVLLDGTGFAGATAVTFGGVAATSFVVKSDSLITAVVPNEGAAKCVSVSHSKTSGLCQSVVVVTTPVGKSVALTPLKPMQGQLQYNDQGIPYAPASCKCELFPTLTEYDFQTTPTIKSFVDQSTSKQMPLPNPEGGDDLMFTGTGFNYLTLDYFTFGDGTQQQNQDSDIESVSYNHVLLSDNGDDTPSPLGSSQAIKAVTAGGTSKSLSETYGAIPEVTSVSSLVVPSSGGETLTLHGLGLTGVNEVNFSSPFGSPSTVVLKNFSVVSSTEMTVLLPSLTPGSYLLSVDNVYGNSLTFVTPPPGYAAASYEVVPIAATNLVVIYPGGAAITGSSNNSCVATGGCTLTLTGINLGAQGSLTVYVGTQIGTVTNDVTVGDVSTLSVTVPPSFLGLQESFIVFVQTANGTTPDTYNALETYT